MTLEQLEQLLIEQGYSKVPSNLPEFAFFFRGENAYVNVLHIVDYKQELYITKDQYTHIKEKIQDFFLEKGIKEVHILSLLVCKDTKKAKSLCSEDVFCWLIDSAENRLLIHENQVADFYGMKEILENFLYEISTTTDKEFSTNSEHIEHSALRKRMAAWSWGNILVVTINVILFIICTFTGDLLYNIGAFSVKNLVENNDWYRMVTCMFLHADISHLVSNMLVLYYIGNVVEKQIGHLPYLIVYFLSGFSGDIFSAGYELFTGHYISSVGASGAVFGIEGALLALVFLHKGKLSDVTAGRVFFAIAFSLYCGFTSSYINNAAHVGGVLMGFLLTGILGLLFPGIRKEQKKGS